jgi:GT2 family glycosyltransferase
MLDDDEVPALDWLSNLLEPVFAEKCDGVGGRVVLDPAVQRPHWLDEPGIGGYLGNIDRGGEERPLEKGELIGSGNGAFRTELLRSIGGFDPAFGRRGRALLAGEDDLLTLKAAEAGAKLLYVPGALVVHELPAERLRRAYFLRRAWGQGRSDWRLQRPQLEQRRLNGARAALAWLTVEAGRRRDEGLGSPAVRFHAACDLTRIGGALWEAAAWWMDRRGARRSKSS